MPDLSAPVEMSFILYTIGTILVVSAIVIVLVKLRKV
jgi:hypothetical protein